VAISAQDHEPAGKTYGFWPWYIEEALEGMSPTDPASAGRCANPLLMIQAGHSDQLDKPLREGVGQAIIHAARSVERRGIEPDNSEVAIRDIGVLFLAAQQLKLADLRANARERLRQFNDHVVRQGSLTQYNSPMDSIAALQVLSRMLWLVRDARDRMLVAAIHDLTWKQVATQFHPPTRQWAGPHSRCQTTDLRENPAVLAFLQDACGGKADFGLSDPLPLSLEAYRIPLQCPRQWVKHFVRIEQPKAVAETFVKSDASTPGSQNPVVGTTWMDPRFTLGSINQGDLWQERRPLVAYWGTPDSPRYLRVRFLKDDRDFASALFFSVQHEGAVLAAVTFATDHGDRHPSLDPIKEGTIRARDLRLRFELGGTADGLTVRTIGTEQKHLVIQDRNVRWVIRPIGDAFGDRHFTWDFPELKLTNRMDAVAYQGEEQSFKLAELSEAFACFTIQEWPYGEPEQRQPDELKLTRGSHAVGASFLSKDKLLQIAVEKKPQPFAAHCDLFASRISNWIQNDLRPSN
jgi:hypothetical protein